MMILAWILAIVAALVVIVVLPFFFGRFVFAGNPPDETVDLLVYTAPRNMYATVNNVGVELYQGDKIIEHEMGRTMMRWLDFDQAVERGEIVRHAEADDGDNWKGYIARNRAVLNREAVLV